jgi:hypothetical protein
MDLDPPLTCLRVARSTTQIKNPTVHIRPIVIPPANTGNDSNNNIAVKNIDQTNRGNLWNVIPGALIFNIVVIKFIEPKIDEVPAK